jgi:hypothetical protein
VRLCRSFIERQLSGVYTYITSQDIGFLLIKSTFWIENACLEFIWTLKKIKNTLETPAPCGPTPQRRSAIAIVLLYITSQFITTRIMFTCPVGQLWRSGCCAESPPRQVQAHFPSPTPELETSRFRSPTVQWRWGARAATLKSQSHLTGTNKLHLGLACARTSTPRPQSRRRPRPKS